MAIDMSRKASTAADQRPSQVSLEHASYSCSRCGYGIAVAGLLPTCPMCGADAWQPERLRGRGARPFS